MFTLKNLSGYAVDSNINIACATTGEIVHPINGQYKLTTDELIDLPITGKQIYLVRRFTKEQLSKLMETAIPIVEQDGTSIENGTGKVEQTAKMEQDSEQNGTDNGYLIQGVTYKTLRDASKVVGTPHVTLKRWIDSGKEGYSKL